MDSLTTAAMPLLGALPGMITTTVTLSTTMAKPPLYTCQADYDVKLAGQYAYSKGDNVLVYRICIMVTLIVSLGVMLAFYFLDLSWRKRMMQLKEAAGDMKQSQEFALKLVKHFMPSWRLEKYQFRGMNTKSAGVNIRFENLSLDLHNGTNVLAGVTGEFAPSRCVAIMGPSGAGKTTFLNVLTGKATYGKPGGKIFVNQKEIDTKSIKSVMGFVPQDDIVHDELTVREQIQFSARLRNKVGTPRSKIRLIVEDVLNVMQVDNIMNSIVGSVEKRGISGGQRKRVNIGLELAAQPTVLFLDEPTSGLDSTSSLAVILSLKKLCQLGTTCVMVIHQPRYSLFTLFDDVILLGKGGRTVFLGPSREAKPYLQSLGFEMAAMENPADWFMDTLSGEIPNAQIPDFKPEMMFDIWNEKGHVFLNDPARTPTTQSRRTVTQEEDILVLQNRLEEEWDKIDLNRDGVMDIIELKALLGACTRIEPDDKVVEELMHRMAGAAATQVERQEFLDYLCSLRGDIAGDRALDEIESDSDDDVESEESSDSDGDPGFVLGAGGQKVRLQRKIPGFFGQVRILATRNSIQWWRHNTERTAFLLVLFLGASALGILDQFLATQPLWSASSILNSQTMLALLLSIYSLKVFKDRPIFWRECSSGLNIFAFFNSKLWLNFFDLVIMTSLFTMTYYMIREYPVGFGYFVVPYFLVAYVASGWGYFISSIVPPSQGPFLDAIVLFILCGLLGNPQSLSQYFGNSLMKVSVNAVSITRWSSMMNFEFYRREINPIPETTVNNQIFCMYKYTYEQGLPNKETMSYWWCGTIVLLIQGSVLRILALCGLTFLNRDKMA